MKSFGHLALIVATSAAIVEKAESFAPVPRAEAGRVAQTLRAVKTPGDNQDEKPLPLSFDIPPAETPRTTDSLATTTTTTTVAQRKKQPTIGMSPTVRKINDMMIAFTNYITIVITMFVGIGMALNLCGYAYTFNTNAMEDGEEFLRIDSVKNFQMDRQWRQENMRYEQEFLLKQAQTTPASAIVTMD